MSTEHKPQQRSRNGCWTCKRRRRKCDESKPICNTCRENGHVCEGYENRLRWNVGVASRGNLTGAPDPRPESAPPRPKGRQRDLLKEAQQSTALPALTYQFVADSSSPTTANQSSPSAGSLGSPEGKVDPTSVDNIRKDLLYHEFLSSGCLKLHSTHVDESPLQPRLPFLCQQSQALYSVCIACQAYMNYGSSQVFYHLYSEALSTYRACLNHALRTTDEALLTASLLLCTIGMLSNTPWTIHIHGMQRLLDDRTAMSPLDVIDPGFINAIEVMGFFDLHRFVIGRQTPSLHIWRKYRAGQLVRFEEGPDSVVHVAGIPRSLLDLMARTDDELSEDELWIWPGCEGTNIQCQLWEAYRFAIMLSIRRRKPRYSPDTINSPSTHLRIPLPTDEVLLTKAISAIESVYNGSAKPQSADSLVMNAILYPLFHTSLDVLSTEDRKGRHDLVLFWWKLVLAEELEWSSRAAWNVLEQVAASRRKGIECDPEEVARRDRIEVALM